MEIDAAAMNIIAYPTSLLFTAGKASFNLSNITSKKQHTAIRPNNITFFRSLLSLIFYPPIFFLSILTERITKTIL